MIAIYTALVQSDFEACVTEMPKGLDAFFRRLAEQRYVAGTSSAI